jgi:hypothetical protein
VRTFHQWLLENENHFAKSAYTINGKNYNVSELANWAEKNLRPVALNISDIQKRYENAKGLFIDVEQGDDWYKRSMNANLSFPILVFEKDPNNSNGEWEIIDGNHRVWRAWKDGMKTISAYLINSNSLSQI